MNTNVERKNKVQIHLEEIQTNCLPPEEIHTLYSQYHLIFLDKASF